MARTPSKDQKRIEREQRKAAKREARERARAEKAEEKLRLGEEAAAEAEARARAEEEAELALDLGGVHAPAIELPAYGLGNQLALQAVQWSQCGPGSAGSILGVARR